MRQRQDAWRKRKLEQERTAEQRARQEAEARRQEEQRRREEVAAAEQARWEAHWAEQRRLQEIAAEQQRQQWEADERRRREQEAAAEQKRLQQEQFERQQAQQWWDTVSAAQVEQLRGAISEPVWTKEGIRLEFDTAPTATHGYGIAIRRNRQLHGIMRPSPAYFAAFPRRCRSLCATPLRPDSSPTPA